MEIIVYSSVFWMLAGVLSFGMLLGYALGWLVAKVRK
jgi:hypothetical protein